MNKPNNYDTTSSGDFTPIELGGHYMIIKKLEETTSKAGKPMIKFAFDFVDPDKQADYFMKSFRDDIRPEKKWPAAGYHYVITEDINGNCSRSFKQFITAVEKSNSGFTVKWGLDFADQFKNKKLGGVFGIVEEEYNGKVNKKHKLRWVCTWDAVEKAEIPQAKLLATIPTGVTTDPNGYITNIPDSILEEVPWA